MNHFFFSGRKQYLWARKKTNVEDPVCLSSTESSHTIETENHNDKNQSTNEDALDLSTKEINHKKEVEGANNLLTSFNSGGSSSSDMNIAHHDQLPNIAGKGAPSQTTAEATPPAPTLGGHNQSISDEDVYGGLDNIFEIENTFHSFDHLKDYKMWPY